MAKKNSRRGNTLKVTKSQLRKQKRLSHFGGVAKFAHRVPIEGWDNSKTLKQNYKDLGIHYDANHAVTNPKKAAELPDAQFVDAKEYGLLTKKLTALQNAPPKPVYQVKSMSVQEQYRLQDLIKKHGDNYQAMQRDLKLNITQETATQLEKRITLMRKLQNLGTEEEEESELEEQEEDEDVYDEDDEAEDRAEAVQDLMNDPKFQSLFEGLSAEEQMELLEELGMGGEGEEGDFFFGDEDEDMMDFDEDMMDEDMFEEDEDEEEEAPQLVVAAPQKSFKTKLEKGDGGAILVKPRLLQSKFNEPKVLKRK